MYPRRFREVYLPMPPLAPQAPLFFPAFRVLAHELRVLMPPLGQPRRRVGRSCVGSAEPAPPGPAPLTSGAPVISGGFKLTKKNKRFGLPSSNPKKRGPMQCLRRRPSAGRRLFSTATLPTPGTLPTSSAASASLPSVDASVLTDADISRFNQESGTAALSHWRDRLQCPRRCY